MARAALLALAASGAHASEWTSCATGPASIKVSNMTVIPEPGVAGEDVTLHVDGAIDAPSNGCEIQITVKFGSTPLYQMTNDICKDTTCPMAAGPIEVNYKTPLPVFIPAGSYTVEMECNDKDDGRLLFCLDVTVPITRPSVGEEAEAAGRGLEREVEDGLRGWTKLHHGW